MKDFKTLSIGNIVINDYSVYKIKAIYVNTRVDIDLQRIEPAFADVEIATTLEKLSFIPLSLSVLENFGFKYFTNEKQEITYTHLQLERIWIVERKKLFTCFIGPNHLTINFLHELQNLILLYEPLSVEHLAYNLIIKKSL